MSRLTLSKHTLRSNNMKHRVFLIAALFACVLGGLDASAAEEARKIEQFIAKNIDGTISDFSLFYRNTTDSELRIDAFSTANHYLSLGTEKGNYIYTAYIDPPRFYAETWTIKTDGIIQS